MKRRRLRRCFLLPLLGLLLAGGDRTEATDEREPVVVIVHPRVEENDATLGELRRILMGDRRFWSRELPVTLLVPPPGTAERQVLLEEIYDQSEAQFRRYWIAKVFRTEATSGPKEVPTPATAVDLTGRIPGAIALIRRSGLKPGVKVLRVGGKLPDDPGYPFRVPAKGDQKRESRTNADAVERARVHGRPRNDYDDSGKAARGPAMHLALPRTEPGLPAVEPASPAEEHRRARAGGAAAAAALLRPTAAG